MKPNRSGSISAQEKVEDGIFELLMDEKVLAEGEELLREAEALNRDPEPALPQGHEARFQKKLDRAIAQRRHQSRKKRMIQFTKRAVIACLVLAGVFGGMYATVDAFRVSVNNLLVNIKNEYIEFGVQEGTQKQTAQINWHQVYLPAEIPDGFSMVSFEKNNEYLYTIQYENESGNYITYYVVGGGFQRLDSEQSDTAQSVEINGRKGVLSTVKNTCLLCWYLPDDSSYASIHTDLDPETALQIAEHVKYIK